MADNKALTIAPQSGPVRSQVQFVEDWFIYDLDVLALAQNGVNNSNIQIQADSDFKLTKLALMADIAGAAQLSGTLVIPLVTLQITDTGSGRQLFSSPVAAGALFGTGQLPFILPVPRIFKARTNISVQCTNYSGGGGTTYNIRMAFIGSKIFQLS